LTFRINYAGLDKYLYDAEENEIESFNRNELLNVYNELKEKEDLYVMYPDSIDKKYNGRFDIEIGVNAGFQIENKLKNEFAAKYNINDTSQEEADINIRLVGKKGANETYNITVECNEGYYTKFDSSLLDEISIILNKSVSEYKPNKYWLHYYKIER